eukprot:COSAG05_NODE_2961_length_2461_cov_4.234124_4_plen_139_part_00
MMMTMIMTTTMMMMMMMMREKDLVPYNYHPTWMPHGYGKGLQNRYRGEEGGDGGARTSFRSGEMIRAVIVGTACGAERRGGLTDGESGGEMFESLPDSIACPSPSMTCSRCEIAPCVFPYRNHKHQNIRNTNLRAEET